MTLFLEICFFVAVAYFSFSLFMSKKFYNPYKLFICVGKKGSGKSTLITKLAYKYTKRKEPVFLNCSVNLPPEQMKFVRYIGALDLWKLDSDSVLSEFDDILASLPKKASLKDRIVKFVSSTKIYRHIKEEREKTTCLALSCTPPSEGETVSAVGTDCRGGELDAPAVPKERSKPRSFARRKPIIHVLLDESGLDFDCRQWDTFPKEMKEFFVLQRKKMIECFLFSQSLDIDKSIRDKSDALYLVECNNGWLSYARKIKRKVVFTKASDFKGSTITDELKKCFPLLPSSWKITFIPKWTKYFDTNLTMFVASETERKKKK